MDIDDIARQLDKLTYSCPQQGSDIGNSTITIFSLDEAIVEKGISRPETQIPDRLRIYGGTRTDVRAFFYDHFRSCKSCSDFYTTIIPSARSTIDGLFKDS